MIYRAEPQRSPGQHECAVLAISVGQSYHEGAKLDACLAWASKRFPKLTVFVGDSCQHYHMQAGGMPEQEAMAIAHAEGALWLARNADTLTHYKVQIVRWDDVAKSSDYSAIFEQFNALIEDKRFETAIHQDIVRFLKSHIYDLKARNLCKEFLKEELTVHTLLGRQFPGVYLYPGSQLLSEALIRANELPGAPVGIQNQIFCQLNLKLKHSEQKMQIAS